MTNQLNTAPIVSIVIPCHNHRPFLWETINSTLKQTVKIPFEIVFIDDSSTDFPQEVLQTFSGLNYQYAKIEAKNANVARNLGTQMSRGQIIVYLDADNQLLPNFFAETIAPILNNQADLVLGQAEKIGAVKEYGGEVFNQFLPTFESLYLTSSLDTCCAVKKSALQDNPWDEKLGRLQDWDFHLNNMHRQLRYLYIEKPIFKYYIFSSMERETKHNFSHDLINQSKTYVREKYAPYYEQPDTTVMLQTVGRYYCVNEWLGSLLAQDFDKKKQSLLFIDNSNDPNFILAHIVPFIRQHQHLYHSISIFHMRKRKHINISSVKELATARHLRIVSTANAGLDISTGKYMQIYEDDTSADSDAFTKLANLLDKYPLAAAVQGVQRARNTKYSVVAYNFVGNTPKNLFFQRPAGGVTQIDAGGAGCVRIDANWLRHNGGFRLHGPTKSGHDISLGWTIKNDGRVLLADWSIDCQHLHLSADGRKFPLSMKSFNEPASIFLNEYLRYNTYWHGQLVTVEEATPLQKVNRLTEHSTLNFNFVIHSITSLAELTKQLAQLSFNPDFDQLILLADNLSAHHELAQHHFPKNTVLKEFGTNLADLLNAQLNSEDYDYLVILHPSACHDYNLKNRLTSLRPNPVFFALVKTSSGFNPSFTADYTVALNLAVIQPKHLPVSKLFNRRLTDVSALSLSFVLSLNRLALKADNSRFIHLNPSAKLNYRRKARFLFSLGIIMSQEVPIKQYRSFMPVFKVNHFNILWRCFFWLGVMTDFVARLILKKKRFYLP